MSFKEGNMGSEIISPFCLHFVHLLQITRDNEASCVWSP